MSNTEYMEGTMEDDELDEVINYLLEIDASDFITMAKSLYGAWEATGYGVAKIYKDEDDHNVLELHTNGWSECEEIIAEIQHGLDHKPMNYFWTFYWYQSTRGGHYIFKDFMSRSKDKGVANVQYAEAVCG